MCDAHLTCSRVDASPGRSSVVDHKNVCGAVCPHAVPVEGTFISSPAHENFAQYVALLGVVQEGLGLTVETFLLDINCQFSKHLRANYPRLAGGMSFYIGWLHAKAGHNLECQLEFNAMFGGGEGRCIGESIEQLWVSKPCKLCPPCCFVWRCGGRTAGGLWWGVVLQKNAEGWQIYGCPLSRFPLLPLWLRLLVPLGMQAALNVVARIQRYEALPHRLVTLELAVHHYAMGKYARSSELLVQVRMCITCQFLPHNTEKSACVCFLHR